MTTDLYSGTLRRQPVAMVPRVADAENRVKASCSESSHLDDRLGHVDLEPSDPFVVAVVVIQRTQESPSVIRQNCKTPRPRRRP